MGNLLRPFHHVSHHHHLPLSLPSLLRGPLSRRQLDVRFFRRLPPPPHRPFHRRRYPVHFFGRQTLRRALHFEAGLRGHASQEFLLLRASDLCLQASEIPLAKQDCSTCFSF